MLPRNFGSAKIVRMYDCMYIRPHLLCKPGWNVAFRTPAHFSCKSHGHPDLLERKIKQQQSWVFLSAKFVVNVYIYSTGHGHCSTYTRVNCVQYGGFPRKIHAKNSRVTFYRSFYTQTFYTQILSVLLRWLILLTEIHASCVYFFTTENVADVKLETDIVEKRLFAVKEKTTCYTLSLTTNMLRSRTSCFVINDFLGCWLKRYFTCKLGCMFLATTVVLK